jgi:hypothetical protein
MLSASELKVCVLRSVGELGELREVWNSWPGNRDSEFESFLSFVNSNQETVRPHVLLVSRNGRPDSILVGRIDRGHIDCRLGYLHLRPRARIMRFVYGALRGNQSRENCQILLNSVLRSLSEKEADVAYMNYLREDSHLCELASKGPGLLNRDYIRARQPHFATSLPTTTDEFYKRLSSGARWQAKSRNKKILKDFGDKVSVRCFQNPSEVEELIRDVEEVARKSYQRGLGVGFADGAETRKHLLLKAEHGWLRAYVLYLGGEPTAFWMGDVNESIFGSDHLGYDPAFAKYSPGMYLILRVIEGFCDERQNRITGIDFATGHARYKEILSTEVWQEVSVYIFASTIKGVALNFARTLIGGMDIALKRALVRTNLLEKVKKAWRGRATPDAVHEAG